MPRQRRGSADLAVGSKGVPCGPGVLAQGQGPGESLECVNREHPKATTEGPLA